MPTAASGPLDFARKVEIVTWAVPEYKFPVTCDVAGTQLTCHGIVDGHEGGPGELSSHTEIQEAGTISGATLTVRAHFQVTYDYKKTGCRLVYEADYQDSPITLLVDGRLTFADAGGSTRYTAASGPCAKGIPLFKETRMSPVAGVGTWRILAGVGLCGEATVAQYVADLPKQLAQSRPQPGSTVALVENGQPCMAQVPAAAAELSAPSQTGPAQFGAAEPRVVIVDGKPVILTSADPAAAKAPGLVMPNFLGEFEKFADGPALIGPQMPYLPGGIVLPPLPNPPGYKTGFDKAMDWTENQIAAQLNWAKENKADAALAVLSTAVGMALPEVPAVAALGPIGASLVSGLTAPVTIAFTKSFTSTMIATGRSDKAALAAAEDTALVVLKNLPSAYGGGMFKTVAGEIGAGELATTLMENAGQTGGSLLVAYGPTIVTQAGPPRGGVLLGRPWAGSEPQK